MLDGWTISSIGYSKTKRQKLETKLKSELTLSGVIFEDETIKIIKMNVGLCVCVGWVYKKWVG